MTQPIQTLHTLIVGSGMAGVLLAEELRKRQPDAPITLLTRETHGYYSRPMLSHGFSRDDVEDKIVLKTFDQLKATGLDVQCGVDVTGINPQDHTVLVRTPAGDETRHYDRLVLAPGSEALVPPPLRGSEGLFDVVNSLDDLILLRRKRATLIGRKGKAHWAVIGGGLIGCEVASDLAKAGDEVTLFHALNRLMERQLVEEDSASLLQVLQDMGMTIQLDAAVSGLATSQDTLTITTGGGVESGFDAILVACGFKPRTSLAQAAGLNVGRGIQVDDFLRTSDPDIFALGDAAECAGGHLYAYVMPIRQQALWLARHLAGVDDTPWTPPQFAPRAKVHGFMARHPYLV